MQKKLQQTLKLEVETMHLQTPRVTGKMRKIARLKKLTDLAVVMAASMIFWPWEMRIKSARKKPALTTATNRDLGQTLDLAQATTRSCRAQMLWQRRLAPKPATRRAWTKRWPSAWEVWRARSTT